ncbi:MAG: GDP-mannose 4,6-dehydratase, partial [Desulfobacteraceae bacterium]|nr:GDP-mannose 4,6-dehydratase [Desulfobacteraceae bacterium]
MRVLITGGAGFIGSHLAEAHLEKGDDVYVIDDLSTGSMDNI